MIQTSAEMPQASGSLRMQEPAELAGRWVLVTRDSSCAIVLSGDRMEEANGWAIASPPPACLVALVPDAVAWRPVPEGLALAAADRRTLVVFTATGVSTATATIGGQPATLRRNQ